MDKRAPYIHAIQDAYPDLSIETVQLNQHGQFNDILVVNNESIFRFPKTQREAARLGTEIALLRSLQSHVTLPIPDPLYQSKEATSIGQIFMGYRLLPGEPLWPETLKALKDEEVQHLADQLATFLRQLHTIPVDALEVKLPDFQGCEEWRDLYKRFRSKLFPFMRPDARCLVAEQFEDFLSDERNCHYTPTLVHGDFGRSNILYNAETKSISGIIDFSSAGWGDPAVDFAAILSPVCYGEPFLERFSVHYPGIEALLSRARFYVGTFALQEALFGLEDGDREAFERGIVEYR
ncbi:aminoglycoside phosphotransferase family protein [Ktedonosporobacter rubrisoli]|uniref:Aminoglycoside phosphotransferase family protein n=1 Tax=Ktedonosporobacter rubrisoli TaxID=2509675 RepID=A0A4P6JJJ4_KTERU|nr:aminoglycoside phosphotransferase family protein [Ktedonosporobacter rubrisoli]QBD75102.1 aminoglycoside phosphotransferase family protein [Ktedonosporobacter rubrisoli]